MSSRESETDSAEVPNLEDAIPFALVDLGLTYRNRRALDHVSLTGNQGINVLLGPNGAGKTSLLKILMGEVRPSTGSARVSSFNPVSERRPMMRKVGWMPQDPKLPKGSTLRDFVTYAGWLKGMSWTRARRAADVEIRNVDLFDRLEHKIGSLSGGMQRRAAFAAAAVNRPSLLILDEPMNGLDPEQRGYLKKVIKSYSSSSCVLMSTHILQDLPDLADQVVVLAGGKIRFDGTFAHFMQGSTTTGAGSSIDSAYSQVVRDFST